MGHGMGRSGVVLDRAVLAPMFAPPELITEVCRVLRGQHAEHYLPGVLTALGRSVLPEPVLPLPDGVGEAGGGRALDAATVLQLARLLHARPELLAAVVEVVRPWLPPNTGRQLALAPPLPEPSPDETARALPPDGVTVRQVEVLDLVSRGYSDDAVARTLFLSQHTVKSHVARVRAALDTRTRAHAVRIGFERGLLTLDD